MFRAFAVLCPVLSLRCGGLGCAVGVQCGLCVCKYVCCACCRVYLCVCVCVCV